MTHTSSKMMVHTLPQCNACFNHRLRLKANIILTCESQALWQMPAFFV